MPPRSTRRTTGEAAQWEAYRPNELPPGLLLSSYRRSRPDRRPFGVLSRHIGQSRAVHLNTTRPKADPTAQTSGGRGKDVARVTVEAVRALGHCWAGWRRHAPRGRRPEAGFPRLGDQPYWVSRVTDLGMGAVPDRRSDPDRRVPVSRAQDRPDLRNRRTSDRRGRHDPHRWDHGGQGAVARHDSTRLKTTQDDEPREAASARVNTRDHRARTREPTNPGNLNRRRPPGPCQAERCPPRPPGASARSRRLAARNGCKRPQIGASA